MSNKLVLDHGNYVPALLIFISNKMSRSSSALYRRCFGVGIIEWRILAMLAVERSIPASRICQQIGLDKGPVSRSLAFMEQRGLVTIAADATDSRRRLAALTPSGQALHDRIIVVALEREQNLLSCMTNSEQATLIKLLNLLHDNLGVLNRPALIPAPAPATAAKRTDDKRRSRRVPHGP